MMKLFHRKFPRPVYIEISRRFWPICDCNAAVRLHLAPSSDQFFYFTTEILKSWQQTAGRLKSILFTQNLPRRFCINLLSMKELFLTTITKPPEVILNKFFCLSVYFLFLVSCFCAVKWLEPTYDTIQMTLMWTFMNWKEGTPSLINRTFVFH